MSKAGFRLADHPWWSLLIFVLTWTLVMAFFFNMLTFGFNQPPDAPMTILIQNTLAHITTLFLLVPLVLRLPTGTRSFKTYLDAIRLSRVRPFFRLLLLGLSCYLILALCQAAGVLVYRALHGQPITLNFLRFAFDLASDLPPRSSSWLQSLPSVFEEVAFRGVILTLFLRHYPKPQSILIASLAFGAMHLLQSGGRERAALGAGPGRLGDGPGALLQRPGPQVGQPLAGHAGALSRQPLCRLDQLVSEHHGAHSNSGGLRRSFHLWDHSHHLDDSVGPALHAAVAPPQARRASIIGFARQPVMTSKCRRQAGRWPVSTGKRTIRV
jgi:membrane protease YdiL (CAAX protease family)